MKLKAKTFKFSKCDITENQLSILEKLNVSNFQKTAMCGGRNAIFLRSFDRVYKEKNNFIVRSKITISTVSPDGSLSVKLKGTVAA